MGKAQDEIPAEEVLQRSVCYWIESDEELSHDEFEEEAEHEDEDDEPADGHLTKQHASIPLDEVVLKHGVPESIFVYFVSKDMSATESCQSLPFTLLLVISYTLLAINHDVAPMVNAVEDSIGHDIEDNANFAFTGAFMGHKDINDVNTHADFWSWMQRGFLPLLWQQSYSLSEGRNMSEPYVEQFAPTYTRRQRGVLLNYNRIVLGVRMSQERTAEVIAGEQTECAFERLKSLYNKECVGGRGYELEPEVFEARKTTNPTRIHWLYINDDVEYIRQQLVQMEKSGWLDENTKKIELAMPVYNAEYGIHTMFLASFFFSRGGHIWKSLIPLSAFAQTWNSKQSIFYDLIWMLCIVYVIVIEGMEIVDVLREHGTIGVLTEYIGFWNGVDWVSVVAGLVICTMFLANVNNLAKMNDAISELGDIDEAREKSKYRVAGKGYVTALEAEIQFAYIFRMVQALYPLFIALRLFKAFGSQPRLAVVTQTLKKAWVDLFHFGIIFVSVFFTYTVAAVVLFGREVHSFTTLFRAMITCFRAMFGDFDWDELRLVGRSDAFLWFLPFMVIIVLVLLNMLIAIVMDAYDEVITGLDHEDGMLIMMKKAYKQKLSAWRKEDVPMFDVLRGVNAKIKERLKRQKEEDEGADLGDDIDSDESDDHMPKGKFGGNSAGKFGKKSKKPKATRALKEKKETCITIGVLKELFPDVMHTWQAKKLIKDGILHYYRAHKQVGDINELLTTVSRINYRTKRLKDKTKARMEREGLAVNNPDNINNITQECLAEIDTARQDLVEWLTLDEDDIILPTHWLRPAEKQAHSGEVAVSRSSSRVTEWAPPARSKGGLLATMKSYAGGDSGTKGAPDGHEGGTLQLLADEDLVLKACRGAGISSTYDHLRKQAVGKHVQVLARDDDGTVMVRIPGVGDVWFAATAFVPSVKSRDDYFMEDGSTQVSDSGGADELEARAAGLEQEVTHGKEVVEECLQALKTLHDDVMKMKADKRKGVEKFQHYRHQAVALQRENVAEKERFKQSQALVKEVTSDRDNYYEKVKQLVKENHDLEILVEQAEITRGVSPRQRR